MRKSKKQLEDSVGKREEAEGQSGRKGQSREERKAQTPSEPQASRKPNVKQQIKEPVNAKLGPSLPETGRQTGGVPLCHSRCI